MLVAAAPLVGVEGLDDSNDLPAPPALLLLLLPPRGKGSPAPVEEDVFKIRSSSVERAESRLGGASELEDSEAMERPLLNEGLVGSAVDDEEKPMEENSAHEGVIGRAPNSDEIEAG